MKAAGCVGDEQLWDLLDDPDGPESARQREHVASCALCGDRLRELRRLHASLESVCRAEPPAEPSAMGPYSIVRRLGEGGMGVVYEAEQREPRRRVAVKVMRCGGVDAKRGAKLFRREVEALGRLRHPGLVAIHDAGQHEGELYLVMELVDGEPLGRAGEQRALPLRCRVDLCARIADAIHHAHQRGVLHLDLKPANVLVDGDGSPRVLDFGLARFLRATGDAAVSQSMLGSPLGTLPYMSPEQLRGQAQLDGRADVYALGVILYQLLTGKLPYGESRNVPEALHALETEPRPPAALAAVPRALSDVVMQAIAVERDKRYATAEAFGADLRRWLGGEHVVAHPPRRRWLRSPRQRQSATMAAAMLGVAAVAIWLREPPAPSELAQRSEFDIPGLVFGSSGESRAFDVAPDGKRIVYIVNGKLRMWNLSTSVPEHLAIEPGTSGVGMPRWDPSGARIALLAATPGRSRALCVLDLASGRCSPRVTPDEAVRALCWSRDGELLIYATADGGIHAAAGAGGEARWTRSIAGRVCQLGGESPDRRWLLIEAAVGIEGARPGVWVLPVGGGSGSPTVVAARGSAPCWAENGRAIYYVGRSNEREGGPNLWQREFDPDSGRPVGPARPVTNYAGTAVRHPILLAGGSGVMYGLERKREMVVCAEHDAFDAGTPLIRGRDPLLTPDGRLVVFLGDAASTRRSLYVMPVSGGEPRRVASDAFSRSSYFELYYSLSPDGSRAAYLAETPDGLALRIVPIAGGAPRTVAQTEDPANPRWSPAGDRLAFVDRDRLYIVAADGSSAPRRLAPERAWHPDLAWSPRAPILAAFGCDSDSRSANQLFLVDVTSGATACITPGEESTYKELVSWHPSGEFCTYVGAANTENSQVRFAFTDGRASVAAIDQHGTGHWDYAGVWAPDGRRFLFQSFHDDEPSAMHVFDLHDSRVVRHGISGLDGFPRWSADGRAVVWTRKRKVCSFEILSPPH